VASVFFSYSHADEGLRDQLEKQLSILKRQGVIETWHDRRIGAGQDFGRAIDDHVESDDIILLLVSSDFLASDYCYEIEMKRAMERHAADDAIVIPVILRPCEWMEAPFGKLMGVPTDGKAITLWPDRDQAMLEVAKAIRAAANRANLDAGRPNDAASPAHPALATPPAARQLPRSSNLRVAKRFTEQDQDDFYHEAFDYMARFFENSLAELGTRNPGVEGRFRRVDADRFTAVAYRDGKAVCQCTVFLGGLMGKGIAYAYGISNGSNTLNESLSVGVDDQSMFLKSIGMSNFGRSGEGKLTLEGAAEGYWSMFIEPLQRGH
jgi:hypothetical protein